MTVRANLVFVASLFPVVTHGEDCHGKACHVEAVNRSEVDAGTEVEASEIGIVITGIGMQFAEKTDGEYVVQLNVAFTIGKHVFRNFVAVNGSLVQVIIKEGVKETRLDMADMKKQYIDMDKRLVKVEESTKSAHHRLDNVIGNKERSAG